MIISAEKQFPNHFMLDAKNLGTSRAFVGNVGLHFYLVNDWESSWDERSVAKFEKVVAKAITLFETQASEYGAWLKLKYTVSKVSLKMALERRNWRQALRTILNADGFDNLEEFKEKYESRHNFDDSCVVLVLNKCTRGFASTANTRFPRHVECGVVGKEEGIFTSSFSKGTLMHEILHLFGAHDYYYPHQVELAARLYFERSVMLGSDCEVVDPLTAYLIGWKKHIDSASRLFLKDTRDLTYEDINAAIRSEWQK